MIKRRDFITLLGGAAAWPIAARAQQAAIPVVGYLYAGTPEASTYLVAAFRKGLNESGHYEGRNVAIEFRWAYNDYERLTALAAELVARRVAVIFTGASPNAVEAAKRATAAIPIVFATGFDPVRAGLVATLNRPGANLTGLSIMNTELIGKQLGLLHELLPRAVRLAVLVNPQNPNAEAIGKDAYAAAAALGLQLDYLRATTNRDIDLAVASIAQGSFDGLLVSADTMFANRRVQLATLAIHHRLPVIMPIREFPEGGGLMSYGVNTSDQYRQAGLYVGRILRGEKPSDLPVMQPTKFEFVINLHTARLLGLDVPPALIAIANEIIE